MNVCVYAHVYTYVNSTDMNDDELQQMFYWLLDSIYSKSSPIDREEKNSISAMFYSPTLP